jgi:curved DNA-binding protein CbpA
MQAKRTFYEVLGVHHSATKHQIKKAYLTLAKTMHPDLYQARLDKQQQKDNNNNDNDESVHDTTEEFKLVTEAYDILSDVDARKQYDSQTLKLFEGSDYYFVKNGAPSAGTTDDFSGFMDRNRKTGKKTKLDAIFMQKFKEELEYRRKRRYMNQEDIDLLDSKSRRHFFHTSQLFYDQFKPPKIKNWRSSLSQDSRARSIRMKQVVLMFIVFIGSLLSLLMFRVNQVQKYDLPKGANYQEQLLQYYKKKGAKLSHIGGLDEGLPEHKL